jgi:hypothetical protein
VVPSDQVDVNVHPQNGKYVFDVRRIFNMVRLYWAERLSGNDISPTQGIKMPTSTYLPSSSYRGASIRKPRSLWNLAAKQPEVPVGQIIIHSRVKTISGYGDSLIK